MKFVHHHTITNDSSEEIMKMLVEIKELLLESNIIQGSKENENKQNDNIFYVNEIVSNIEYRSINNISFMNDNKYFYTATNKSDNKNYLIKEEKSIELEGEVPCISYIDNSCVSVEILNNDLLIKYFDENTFTKVNEIKKSYTTTISSESYSLNSNQLSNKPTLQVSNSNIIVVSCKLDKNILMVLTNNGNSYSIYAYDISEAGDNEIASLHNINGYPISYCIHDDNIYYIKQDGETRVYKEDYKYENMIEQNDLSISYVKNMNCINNTLHICCSAVNNSYDVNSNSMKYIPMVITMDVSNGEVKFHHLVDGESNMMCHVNDCFETDDKLLFVGETMDGSNNHLLCGFIEENKLDENIMKKEMTGDLKGFYNKRCDI